MSNNTQQASDWLVSITPAPRGDWVSPGGIRHNFTMHNGATAEMVTAMIAEMDKLADVLQPASGITPPVPQQPSQHPPTVVTSPPQGASGAGMDIYGVGFVAQGATFVQGVARVVQTATSKGKPSFDLYFPGHQYRDATVFEKDFDKLGLVSAGEYDPPVEMVFAVGKQKQNSDKHYIDFVGLPSSFQPTAAPASDAPPQFPDGYFGRLTNAVVAEFGIDNVTAMAGIDNHLKAGNIFPGMTEDEALAFIKESAAKKAAMPPPN